MAQRALLIGVNVYEVPGGDLRGCVNDVLDMEDVLKKYYDFRTSQIKKLVDRRATQRNMKSGIRWLIQGARAGDVLLLHYSGHGSNVPDTGKKDEDEDGRDEILCPTDLDWSKPFLDDWLREQFDKLEDKGVQLSVVMDCCHSGSITRAIQPPDAPVVSRFLPNPYDIARVETGRSVPGRRRSTRRRRRRSRTNVQTANIPETLLTGCRSDQTSADAWIRGKYHGAMTYSLVRAIRRRRGSITYRQLHKDMLRYLIDEGYDQRPQLEGVRANLDREFLAPF